MSNPTRERAEEPVVHASDPVPAARDPALPSAAPSGEGREAWRDPVQRTDEIELLISAAMFFGLLQIPGRLIEWWARWFPHQAESGAQFGMMAMQFAYGIVFALLASFLIHLVLRGFWIGLIGLRSVFPQGVDWPKLEKTAPIATAYQRTRMPSIEASIASVDRVASVVFVCASLLVGMTLVGALVVVPLFLLGINNNGWLIAILLVLILPALLVMVLDRGLAAGSPRWAAHAGLRRIVTVLTAIYSHLSPRLLSTPMLTLQSRLPQTGFMIGIMLTMLVVILAFPIHLFSQRYSSSNSAYRFVDDAIARHGITEPDRNGDAGAVSWVPHLDQVQPTGAWAELFVPLQPARDDSVLRADCPAYARVVPATGTTAEDAAAIRDCLTALWRFTLDGTPLVPAQFELARRGEQRGLVAMIPTASLGVGRHQIVAARVNVKADTRRNRGARTPQSLLFWIARPAS